MYKRTETVSNGNRNERNKMSTGVTR